MRSLFGPRPKRVTEATPEQIAMSGAAAGSWGVDPIDGEAGWTPLGRHGREIPDFTLEKARANSVASYRTNPLAKAIVDTYVAFCVGDVGVSYTCSNEDVEEVVKEFWEDPYNDLANRQEHLLRDMLVMGEMCLELMSGENSGVTRFRPVQVSEITGVTLLNKNPMTVDQIKFEINMVPRRPPLTIVRHDDITGLRTGDALWFRPWRTLTSDVRSAPFMMPILDWLDSYDTVLSNLIDRTSLARYLVWDVTVEGGQEAVDNFIRARGGTAIPRSGTVEIHNQSVQWEPKTVSTGAQEDTMANQSVMTLIAGGTGLAKTWLAEPEGANKATSQTMAEPVRRRVQGVQKAYLGCMQELLRTVVDRAVTAGRLPGTITSFDEKTGQETKIPTSQAVLVQGPEVAAADSQTTAQVLLNLSTGLKNLTDGGTLARKAARVAAKKAWEDYTGRTYTADLDEPDEQDKAIEDAMVQQQAAAKLAAQAQPAGAPPSGGGGGAAKPAGRPAGSNGQNVPGVNTGKGKNAPAKEADWDPKDHPRDERGQFTDTPGGFSGLSLDELAYEMPKALAAGDTDRFEQLIAEYQARSASSKPKPKPPVAGGRPSITSEPLSQSERMSVEGYMQTHGNMIYNQGLRDGTIMADPAGVSSVRDLDSAIAKHTVQNDAVVYRGISLPPGLDISVGAVFSDTAYTSTTGDRAMAQRFADMRATGQSDDLNTFMVDALGGEPVVMRIKVPAGSHLMPGDDTVDEFVLPRDARFRVTGRDQDGVVDVEYLPGKNVPKEA